MEFPNKPRECCHICLVAVIREERRICDQYLIRAVQERLVGERTDRRWILYTFLALLELMKLRMIRAYQSESFGTIRLSLAVE